MKFGNVKSVQPIELVLGALFIVYLVFPIENPLVLANMIETPLGMIVIFAITVCLFVYTNPILGVLYIFVAYELLRRSAAQTGQTSYTQYVPTQIKKDTEMRKMNPPVSTTLEEEIIQQMAPVGHSDQSIYVNSTFKPVLENTNGAGLA